MSTVKRAVIMAAGVGKRMRPLTLDTPKPLVRVNGVRMIDTAIRGLYENGIREICIVTGYLGEQFVQLQREYPDIELINNPDYDIYNNISSLYAARELLDEDIMILDGDQMIYNPAVLSPEFELSGYNAVYTDEQTDEWLMQAENGIVSSCSRSGGDEGWQLYSISRWKEEDSRKLRKHLEIEFIEKKNTQIYWDDIAMFCYPGEYRLGIMAMRQGDVVEIDNIRELAGVDCSYNSLLKEYQS